MLHRVREIARVIGMPVLHSPQEPQPTLRAEARLGVLFFFLPGGGLVLAEAFATGRARRAVLMSAAAARFGATEAEAAGAAVAAGAAAVGAAVFLPNRPRPRR